MTINRGCYHTATVKKSPSTDKKFSFGGILHTVNSSSLSEPVSRMGAVRNISRNPFTKDDKRAAMELRKFQVPLSKITAQLKMSKSTLRPHRPHRLHAQQDA
jgi:hypothetical protein